jgi:hypothetical protein
MPADPPAALSARPAGFVPDADPTFAISIPRALRRLIRPSGTTFPQWLALQGRLQAYGPNHWCFIVEPTRDAQILALPFHFGQEPFCANDRAAASIE